MKPDKKGMLKLADHLDTVPDRGFDMNFVSAIVDGKPLSRKHHKAGYECGMAGCMLAHAAMKFPRRLSMKFRKNWLRVIHRSTGRDFFNAFADCFYIPDDDAEAFCHSNAQHKTPKQAADALRLYVKDGTLPGETN